MQFASQLDSYGRQCRAHPLLHRQPQYFEVALARLASTVGETEEVECLRPSQPTPLSSGFRKTSKFNQPRLLRMQPQPKLTQAILQCAHKRSRFAFKLEPNDAVVRVAYHDDFAVGVLLPPAMCPEIKDVMQVTIGQPRGKLPHLEAYRV